MAYELIPGIRQDHRGQAYQLGRYPNGKLINVPVSEPELLPRTKALMEPCEVESKGRSGVVYQSIVFFQGSSA